jgi:acetamidase/formamidase
VAELLTQRLGLTAADATMLMSTAGQPQVSQLLDPLKTACYAMPVEILAQFGRRLV